ncbi:MAG: hypothetical protein M3P96_00770 [Actinomycetota bacterium]|nr:hypothetical protein [Actinomycetota bacterium]
MDRLVQLAGLPAAALLGALGELAELGLARCDNGSWRLTDTGREAAAPSGSLGSGGGS